MAVLTNAQLQSEEGEPARSKPIRIRAHLQTRREGLLQKYGFSHCILAAPEGEWFGELSARLKAMP